MSADSFRLDHVGCRDTRLRRLRDSARYGSWIENACLAHAINAGQKVSYWREEPLEIDGVIEGSWGSWAVEVKAGGLQTAELAPLLEFVRRYPSFRPLVICREPDAGIAVRAGVQAIGWQRFLLDGVLKLR